MRTWILGGDCAEAGRVTTMAVYRTFGCSGGGCLGVCPDADAKPFAAGYKKVAPINQKIETPDKANAQFEAGVRFQMSEDDPDYPAMLLAGYMFGGPITSRVSGLMSDRVNMSP